MDHIYFSLLPVESEARCLWELHPRNESRVGLRINNEYTQFEPLPPIAVIQIMFYHALINRT